MHYRASFNYGCFWLFCERRDFVAVFWSILLVIKAKQDLSGSCFLFNFILLCEWFFDRFLEKTEVTGQIGREWKPSCLGAHLGSLKKTLVAQTHNLGAPCARALVRQQPCYVYTCSVRTWLTHNKVLVDCHFRTPNFAKNRFLRHFLIFL